MKVQNITSGEPVKAENLADKERNAIIAEAQLSKANGYVRRIRNKRKQEYAAAYLGYLQGLLNHSPDSRDYNLGCMGAQSVRFSLDAILNP